MPFKRGFVRGTISENLLDFSRKARPLSKRFWILRSSDSRVIRACPKNASFVLLIGKPIRVKVFSFVTYKRGSSQYPEQGLCFTYLVGFHRIQIWIFFTGRSMGGRVAAEVATNYTTEDDFIWGIFCLSYPLHPPKRFNELRVAHVIHLNLPILFVSGTNDAMCRMDLMEDTIDKIKNDVKVHWVQDADHSLNVKGKFDHDILDKICHWTLEWSQSVFMAER